MTSYLTAIINDHRGWNWKETTWLYVAMIIVAIGSYNATPLEAMAAVFNVACVILVAKGRVSNYYWGLIGVILYAIVAYKQQFYFNMALNVIYIGFQFWGIYEWRKSLAAEKAKNHFHVVRGKHRGLPEKGTRSYDNVTALTPELDVEVNFHTNTVGEKLDVTVKRLSWAWIGIIAAIIAVGTYVFGKFSVYIGGASSYLDAFTLVASLVAMTLMVKQYAEQWVLWVIVNVVSIYMWVIPALGQTGSWAMVAMWSVLLLNALYGLWKWFIVKFNK